MPDWRHRRIKTRRDVEERSYLQYNLIRSLAFGERDWIVLYSLFCALSPAPRDFWTIAGGVGFIAGLFLLGPIYGVFIHLVTKIFYNRLRKKGIQPGARSPITWYANATCAPVIIGISWLMFDLWFDSVASILALIPP